MEESSTQQGTENEVATRRGKNDRRNWLPERPEDYLPSPPAKPGEDRRKWLLPNEKGVPRRKK
jgi:hypothetical protein